MVVLGDRVQILLAAKVDVQRVGHVVDEHVVGVAVAAVGEIVAVDERALAHRPAVVAAGNDPLDLFEVGVTDVHDEQRAVVHVPRHAMAVAKAEGVDLVERVRIAVDERDCSAGIV